MAKKLIPMAICYDFDGTLSPGNMQEYGFIKELGITPREFWDRSNTLAKVKKADDILAYMKVTIDEAKKRKIRSFDDSYGMARLIQAVCDIISEDCMSSELSTIKDNPYETGVGVDVVSKLDTQNGDNGVYYIDNDYNIVKQTDGSELN